MTEEQFHRRLWSVAIAAFFILLAASDVHCAEPIWTGAVIHHSATPATTTFESIRRYHVRERGWEDIGYHYVIERTGAIRTGRGLGQVGAHALNPAPSRNRSHIGICVIGNGSISRQQHEALRVLLRKLRRRFEALKIEPHHQQCPGKQTWERVRHL